MIGFAFCGSFCTMGSALSAMRELLDEGCDILPIMSPAALNTDTRFHKAADFAARVESLTGRRIVRSIAEAEPLGPMTPLDALVVAPCTGNTLAKVAHGITDTAVTMAIKAHLRSERPTVIALASNDALSSNLQSLARLMTRRSVYLVPMRQDDPRGKPYSLVADMKRVPEALKCALRGEQLRPLFLE